MNHQLLVRAARSEDIAAIVILIHEFAEFEKLSEWCEVTEAKLQEAIFGEKSFVQALVAIADNRYVGYALFFPVFTLTVVLPKIICRRANRTSEC